jgi:hypothetical protein
MMSFLRSIQTVRARTRGRGYVGLGILLVGISLTACGDDGITDPVDVDLGETTFVFVLNPTVNDANEQSVPAPGGSVSGVSVSVEDGPSGTTGAGGVVALGPVEAGSRTVSFGGTGELSLSISSGDLREVAVALDGGVAAQMANVAYQFEGQTVVEITPDMPIADVNDELAKSNQIVLLLGGTYTGDLEFSGSNVTLFGEGAEGGNVTINGSVTVSGSGNRIRGARITGDLSVPGSDAGISFSSVAGAVLVDGSDTVLLNNAFCGDVTIEGSGLTALGNAGMPPLAAPASC